MYSLKYLYRHILRHLHTPTIGRAAVYTVGASSSYLIIIVSR